MWISPAARINASVASISVVTFAMVCLSQIEMVLAVVGQDVIGIGGDLRG